jgi:hypothetical protein
VGVVVVLCDIVVKDSYLMTMTIIVKSHGSLI